MIRGTILDPASGAWLAAVDVRVRDRGGRLLQPPARLTAALNPLQARVQELASVSVQEQLQSCSSEQPTEAADVVDWLVSPEDVEGIEVYRDAEIPPRVNPGGLCAG